MSITILQQAATIDGLQDQGTPLRPLSQPPCRMRGIDVALAGAGENQSGLWECEPGRFERQLANAELMHILAGACVFTPTGGAPLEIRAGDTLFFPARTTGVWEIRETLRKVYAVFSLPDEA
ncbi:cupin domain-containing protein [Caldimonas sp. KR1-144]|uniref:cupin domain-containing protein n=1 Tax=Caldimonas sp. KR1-144 TaxID=3400911 RepID=UPI003BFEE093